MAKEKLKDKPTATRKRKDSSMPRLELPVLPLQPALLPPNTPVS
jgi:hypothetical protein